MKIYFCGSIRGGRHLASTYAQLIELLGSYGQVLTEHLGSDEEIESKDRKLSDKTIHDRDMQWIVEADLLVAEVTVPSLGVGYEIGRAIEMKKPVLCLFQEDSDYYLSAMISGSEGATMCFYKNPDELKEAFDAFFRKHAPHRTF